MSDIKLFQISNGGVHELEGASVAVEKHLQTLIERHLDTFLGVRFLASEYSTGNVHGGRVDTLGIDENGNPVIIEYKRATNENVINQGLFYLDWLLDHHGDFNWLVQQKLGAQEAVDVVWDSPRLLCIAGDYTKYDINAVQQIAKRIELFRYRLYGDSLLVLEQMRGGKSSGPNVTASAKEPQISGGKRPKSVFDFLEQSSDDFRDRFESLKAFLLALGDDVQMDVLKHYIAFRRIKNFACVAIHPSPQNIVVWVKVDPSTITLKEGFTRDVRNIGHHGTGDLEITLHTAEDLQYAETLLRRSYEAS